jgi:hypothetical protein
MAASFDHAARRRFLKSVGVNLVVAVPLAMSARALYAGKANKSDFFFQERPKDGKRCGDCRLFSHDTSNPAVGTCTAFDGVINANSWCMLYTPK